MIRATLVAAALVMGAASALADDAPRPASPAETLAVQMLVARHADEFALLKEIAQQRIENARLTDELAKAKAAKQADPAKAADKP